MRKTYRSTSTGDYWAARWSALPVDLPATADDRYPLHYAQMATREMDGGSILELGCGPGRLVRHYHERNVPVVGVDSVAPVMTKLKKHDANLKVVQADARALPFLEGSFDVVLCFGVYHSLESGVELALAETFRVLRPGGRLCAEFRADSLHNRLIDICKGGGSQRNRFHKCNYEEHEARLLLRHAGFVIERGLAAFNMPILYHLPLLRHRSQRTYDEHVCRAEGYRLRPWVECLQDVALRLVPSELCNLWVYICRKP